MNVYVCISIAFTMVALLLLLLKVVQDAAVDPDHWLSRPRCRCCGRKMEFADYSHPSGCKIYTCWHSDCAREGKEVRCH